MARLLIFNCSNDMALSSGASEYVPPKTVARMEELYYKIPLFVASCNDIAISPRELSVHGGFQNLQHTLSEPITQVVPWGWSIPLRNKLLRYGVPSAMLPDEDYLIRLRQLSSRQFGAEYAEQLYTHSRLSQISKYVVQNEMRYITSPDNLHLAQGQYIAKQSWSSSGRGNKIFQVEQSTQSIPTTPFLLDRFYDKVMDLAMEFFINKDSVDYLGLSVFEANKEGRYAFNHVASQPDFIAKIKAVLQLPDEEAVDLLFTIQQIHQDIIANTLLNRYQGPLGIDMMIVRDGGTMKIHPVVELNLRMNMGILALLAYQKYGKEIERLTLQSLGELSEKSSPLI